MSRYFVTGTDTGVGKTHVTVQLAERGRQLGRRVFAWKPIETGCELVNGVRIGPDQEAISSKWQQGELRGAYRFLQPIAPLMAAEAEGTSIELARLDEVFQEGATQADLILVEGAGGWRVPVTAEFDMGGLAKRLGLPVIVVARAGLGTINHTLLTVEAVLRDSQSVAAVVMSCRPDDDGAFADQNAKAIKRHFSGPVIRLWTDPRVLDSLIEAAPPRLGA
jgi:dethiobiotin synthetase